MTAVGSPQNMSSGYRVKISSILCTFQSSHNNQSISIDFGLNATCGTFYVIFHVPDDGTSIDKFCCSICHCYLIPEPRKLFDFSSS
jgi:hypothetical protein